MNLDGVLIGLRGAEQIGLAHRNRGVAWNQHLHQPADRLQPQGQRRDVIEHQIPQLAGEDAGLHRRADRHHLIGVDRLTRFARNQGAHHLLHHRHAGGAAHQHHIVDVFRRQAGIAQGALHRSQQPVEQIGAEGLEAAALQAGFDVQGPLGPRGDEGQGDRRARHPRELDLGLLGGFAQPLQRLAIAAQIEAMLLREGIGHPVDDAPIPVIAAQLGVAAGGLDIKDAVGDAQHRDIEGATAEIEDQHLLDRTAIEAVGQGRRRRFVEDALHRDPRQPAGIAGGLALGIIEIGRHRDHRRLHRFAQVGGGVIDQLAQDAGHQLFRRVFTLGGGADHTHIALVIGPHRVRHAQAAVVELVPAAADEALEVGKGVARIEHQLAPGQLAHQQLLVTTESDHRWGGAPSLGIGNDLRPAAFEHGHHRVGGAQVDANDPPHETPPGTPRYRDRSDKKSDRTLIRP